MIGLKTLVLNANYDPIFLIPIQTIFVEDAVTRVLNGTCHIVYEYDRKIKTQNPNLHMNWPSVIACNTMRNVPKIPKLTTQSLYYRDHAVCSFCNKPLTLKSITVDHVIPRKHGGKTTWENVVSACVDCNTKKADRLPVGEWKPKFAIPYKPSYYDLVAKARQFPIKIPTIEWLDFIGEWKGHVTISLS